MTSAELRGADLTGAKQTPTALKLLHLCCIGPVTLVDANLTGANLTGANLTGANLTGANLTGTNLTRTNLDGTKLTGANLTGANLDGTKLDGVVYPECTDSLMRSLRVSVCGMGRCVGVVDRPTTRVGLFHWVFRVVDGQVSRALDDDRLSATEGRVEQVVPGCFPRPVGW
ncbi:MAG: pentapeptide repeat-containing protein [Rhodococcus sp. (in: high G+C Gram-positive bacteria)]|nr:MAG: pentapeptide repeat-containing protein [Rhodococcus sp. (in: high G+C Gram-positive bacteria)]